MIDTNFNMLPKSFYTEVDGQKTLTVDKALADKVQLGVQARLETIPQAQKEALLAAVYNLAPGDVSAPGALEAKLTSLQNAAKLLADLPPETTAFVGNIAKFLARAMIEMAGEQRQNALADRMNARETAKAELMNQADSMDKAADKMTEGALTALIAGVIGGAISIAGSLGTAVSGLSQLSKMSTAIQSMKGMTPQEAATSLASNAFAKAQSATQVYAGIGQLATSSGEIVKTAGSTTDARLQADAKRQEAQGMRDAADAQFAQQTAELKKEVQDTMNDMIKQIINFIKELKDAEVEAMRALTRV
ncbi:hypothetical protein [Mesorhizobium sp. ANAO-SY3R2]|uniref:hypothetical protein n=1 Tax=Mesorhizobium sp. ANAO-SY3R2 TaxID=3166644 RepID=UPI003670F16A